MFDAKRRETSMVYLSCLGLTLFFVFLPFPPGIFKLFLLVALMMTQFCASTWYTLSYIPFGRRTALSLIRRTLGLEDTSSSNSGGANFYSSVFGGGNDSEMT